MCKVDSEDRIEKAKRMHDDDFALLERIRQGDADSVGVLYDRTREWLLTFVIRPRTGESDAEDVLADTFETALSRLRSFEWRGTPVLHWLSAIARRKVLEHIRRRSRRAQAAPPLEELDPADDVPTAEAELVRQAEVASLRRRVHATLDRLHPRYAQVLRKRLLENRSREECARELGITVSTFDVVLHRAVKAFTKEWEKP